VPALSLKLNGSVPPQPAVKAPQASQNFSAQTVIFTQVAGAKQTLLPLDVINLGLNNSKAPPRVTENNTSEHTPHVSKPLPAIKKGR